MKNYKQGTEITAVGEFERKGKVLNINYCIIVIYVKLSVNKLKEKIKT